VFSRSCEAVDLWWVERCVRWSSSCGRPRAGAANVVLAANYVHDRCGSLRVNIRAHKKMRSEYVDQTGAYGREACDWSTP
jgi:hypothetical protein